MSDHHVGAPTPPTRDRQGRVVEQTNDEAALNGGSIAHMYRADKAERKRPWFTRARVATGLAIFGGLFVGAALLASGA
jgi:hypothetical protein